MHLFKLLLDVTSKAQEDSRPKHWVYENHQNNNNSINFLSFENDQIITVTNSWQIWPFNICHFMKNACRA